MDLVEKYLSASKRHRLAKRRAKLAKKTGGGRRGALRARRKAYRHKKAASRRAARRYYKRRGHKIHKIREGAEFVSYEDALQMIREGVAPEEIIESQMAPEEQEVEEGEEQELDVEAVVEALNSDEISDEEFDEIVESLTDEEVDAVNAALEEAEKNPEAKEKKPSTLRKVAKGAAALAAGGALAYGGLKGHKALKAHLAKRAETKKEEFAKRTAEFYKDKHEESTEEVTPANVLEAYINGEMKNEDIGALLEGVERKEAEAFVTELDAEAKKCIESFIGDMDSREFKKVFKEMVREDEETAEAFVQSLIEKKLLEKAEKLEDILAVFTEENLPAIRTMVLEADHKMGFVSAVKNAWARHSKRSDGSTMGALKGTAKFAGRYLHRAAGNLAGKAGSWLTKHKAQWKKQGAAAPVAAAATA